MSVVFPIAWRTRAPVQMDAGLTQEQAHAIHTDYHNRDLLPEEIAACCDLPLATVQDVLRGAIWPRLARLWRQDGVA